MAINAILILLTIGLFLYWFRYVCRLILTAKTCRDYGSEFAAANRLNFAGIREQVATADEPQLDALIHSLHSEYQVIAGLLGHVARPVQFPVEEWLLRADYRFLTLWYGLTRSRETAAEMCEIVAHFANAMGRSSRSAESFAI